MENATKALLIVAAILITILIIALGIYIYNISNNSAELNVADTMSQLEIMKYNKQYELYAGIQRGTIVKMLLEKASRTNEELYRETSTIKNCVCIRTNDSNILKKFSGDSEMTKGLNGSRDYGVRYPDNIFEISKYIVSSQKYNIWFRYNEAGLIWEINIDEP